MSAFIRKDKTKSLLDEDSSISDVITEAFDNAELTTIGKLCLDARVSKSLTQEQASNLLKVRVKLIKDFENGDQIDLPGTAYKIGFVRSYARLLELDSDLLVKEFKEYLEVNNFKEEYKFLSPEIHNNKILPIGAFLSFFIALIIYSGWYYTDRNNKIDMVSVNGVEKKIEKITEAYDNSYVIIEENFDPKNSFHSKIKNNNNEIKESMLEEKIDIAEVKKKPLINFTNSNLNNEIIMGSSKKAITKSIEPLTNEMSAKANERDPSNEMVLKAIGNSWVEIEDLDGNILMTRLMRPGETYVVPKINGLTFNTGNAGALSLSQGDVVVTKLGEIGEIITARPLNIKAFSKPTLTVE
ncbi:MAG: helix-turn-helix domain-containing protein [Candidatus Puniceispirillales bacterium]